MIKIKTEDELKAEWGIERFVTALGVLAGWWAGKSHPISLEQLKDLQSKSEDALTLFGSRTYYQES